MASCCQHIYHEGEKMRLQKEMSRAQGDVKSGAGVFHLMVCQSKRKVANGTEHFFVVDCI